jgi:hypothetical protein
MSSFTAGYYIGLSIFLLVMFLIFRFVGRWGWIGVAIRILVAALVALRALSLIANPPPSA